MSEKLGDCVVCHRMHYCFESGRCLRCEHTYLRDFALAHPDDEQAWHELDAFNMYVEDSIS